MLKWYVDARIDYSGDITVGDITSILPFGNTADQITLKGKHILEALEHSVAEYTNVGQQGKFLQLSGKLYLELKGVLCQCSYVVSPVWTDRIRAQVSWTLNHDHDPDLLKISVPAIHMLNQCI